MAIPIEGLFAGAAHVLTGPDHLMGVAPLAVEEAAEGARASQPRRVRPWLVGASWGVGHGAGVSLLGALGQTLLSAAQVEVASGWSERLVGLLLIGLGWQATRRASALVAHERRHGHDHEPDGLPHSHGPHHRHAAMGMGLVHGLAGAGHFWAVLPSLAMGRAEAASYIGSYLLASIVLMTVFGALMGRLTASMGTRWMPRFFRAVGMVTIATGAAWLLREFV